jgi:hypothetical protein
VHLCKLQPQQLLARAADVVELVVEHAAFLPVHKLLQPRLRLLLAHRHSLHVLTNMLDILADFDARLRAQARPQQLDLQSDVVLFTRLLHDEQSVLHGA